MKTIQTIQTKHISTQIP